MGHGGAGKNPSDRRAIGSANSSGLGSFNMDSYYEDTALRNMFHIIWTYSTVSVLEGEISDTADKLHVEVLQFINEQLTATIYAS
jgi:hypothetical protein